MDTFDFRILAAKATKSRYNEDNPNWNMATQGPFQTEYWKAMEVELDTLVNEMKSWVLVKRESGMNVLDRFSTQVRHKRP